MAMEEAPRQHDLFEEEFDRLRVFHCIGGAFIGSFNRSAVIALGEEPVHRISAFFPTEKAAHAALSSGAWPPPEPAEP